jgi:hypothetical protein
VQVTVSDDASVFLCLRRRHHQWRALVIPWPWSQIMVHQLWRHWSITCVAVGVLTAAADWMSTVCCVSQPLSPIQRAVLRWLQEGHCIDCGAIHDGTCNLMEKLAPKYIKAVNEGAPGLGIFSVAVQNEGNRRMFDHPELALFGPEAAFSPLSEPESDEEEKPLVWREADIAMLDELLELGPKNGPQQMEEDIEELIL